jgi:hypothetical protein
VLEICGIYDGSINIYWRGVKKMSIIFAGIAFVGLFCAWVIIPSILKKHHAEKSGTELETEE